MKTKRRTAKPKLRTPAEAREWLRQHGITVTAFAAHHGLDRHAVNDALRGVGKGGVGKSHDAAIALGIKHKPDSCTDSPIAPHSPSTAAKAGKGNSRRASTGAGGKAKS